MTREYVEKRMRDEVKQINGHWELPVDAAVDVALALMQEQAEMAASRLHRRFKRGCAVDDLRKPERETAYDEKPTGESA